LVYGKYYHNEKCKDHTLFDHPTTILIMICEVKNNEKKRVQNMSCEKWKSFRLGILRIAKNRESALKDRNNT